MLREKYDFLRASGLERYPKRADFDEADAAMIKAVLGPWPRALEQAGIKPPPEITSADKNRARRIRAKRKRNEEKRGK